MGQVPRNCATTTFAVRATIQRSQASVADTLCELSATEPLPAQPVDPPTLSVTISPNDSPLAGREGSKVQSRVIRERLLRQAEGDVAIWNLEERGVMFISPGDKIYEGMIVGENAKPNDLDVNPLKAKQLTNIRAAGKDEAVRLTPPKIMSLEQAIAYIDEDELVEVTPKSIRLRKIALKPHLRKRRAKEMS